MGQFFNGESKDDPAELKTTLLIITVPLFQSEISRPGCWKDTHRNRWPPGTQDAPDPVREAVPSRVPFSSVNTAEKASRISAQGFPHSSVGKESACNAGDPGSIPGSGRSPGEGNGNPLQYSRLENPMDRGACQTTVHGVTRVGRDLATKTPPYIYKDIVW